MFYLFGNLVDFLYLCTLKSRKTHMTNFDSYNVEFTGNSKVLKKAPADLQGDYTIPAGVTSLAYEAFRGCSNLTGLRIPSSLNKVDYSVFSGCEKLTKIYFDGTLEQWMDIDWKGTFSRGYDLYIQNVLLSNLIVPFSVTEIKPNCFYFCRSLVSVHFHDKVLIIGRNSFNKSCLKGHLVIPEGVGTIEYNAFFCTDISTVSLPSTLDDLEYGVFGCCDELKEINVSSKNEKYKSSKGILYDNTGVLKAVAPCASSEPLQIPDFIREIEPNTFCYDAVPPGGIVLSKNIKKVHKDAFLGQVELAIYIPVGSEPYFDKLGVPIYQVIERFNVETAYLAGHDYLSSIVNNPYRVLGVYSNASQKEITANARKIKRYIEVGKTISFPTDLDEFLPPVVRTVSSVDAAVSSLADPKDKFTSALFWFVNIDDIDSIGLSNLSAGNISKAKDIFGKKDNWHSALNLTTLALIEGKFEDAIQMVTRSMHTTDFAVSLSKTIGVDGFEMYAVSSSKVYIDTLLKDIDLCECRALYNVHGYENEDIAYIDELLVSRYTTLFNEEINLAKNVKDDSLKSLSAAKRLKKATMQPLLEFRYLVGKSSSEYSMQADRIANQILQSSIDFYNSSIDRYAVYDAIELTEYALSIAVGSVKKERCQQNLDILNKIADKIPPREVADDDGFLSSLIVKHKDGRGTIDIAWDILESGAPSIIHIKECLQQLKPNSTAYKRMDKYLTLVSTALVNLSLTKLIDAVNDSYSYDYDLVARAMDLMLNMGNFSLDYEFKVNRFDPNKKTLDSLYINRFRSIFNKIQLTPNKPEKLIDLRTSEEVWNECRSISDLEYYLNRFPNGQHLDEAKQRLERLKIEAEDKLWQEVLRTKKYSNYISLYPYGRYIKEAKLKQESKVYEDCHTIKDYRDYIATYPNGRYVQDAQKQLDSLVTIDNETWNKCTCKRDFEDYCSRFPLGLHLDEAKVLLSKIKKRAEVLKWLIAIEVVAIVVLCLFAFCSLTVAKNVTMGVVLVSFIAGILAAAIKYGNS